MVLLGISLPSLAETFTFMTLLLTSAGATCGGFASTLRSDYEEALRIVFQDYASSLSAVRTHLAREKHAIEPCLKRWQELFLTLKAIEQDL